MTLFLIYLTFAAIVGFVTRDQLTRISDKSLAQWLEVNQLPSGLADKNRCAVILGLSWPLIVILALVPDDAR